MAVSFERELLVGEQRLIVVVDFDRYPETLFGTDIRIAEGINSGDWFKEGARIQDVSQASINQLISALNIPRGLKERVRQACEYWIVFRPELLDLVRRERKATSYEDFCRTTTDFLAHLTGWLLRMPEQRELLEKQAAMRANPELANLLYNTGSDATAQALTVSYSIMDGTTEQAAAVYDGTNSTAQRIRIEIAGELCVGRLYFPYIYTQKIDSEILLNRYLREEFGHRFEDLVGKNRAEGLFRKSLARAFGVEYKNWEDYMLNFYGTGFGFLSEGLETFIESRSEEAILFDRNKVKGILKKLEKLARTTDAEKEKQIYDEEFSPDAHSGEYYLGLLMCYTIGLALSQRKEGWRIIKIWSKEWRWREEELSLKDRDKKGRSKIDLLLREHALVRLGQLDEQSFAETVALLKAAKNHLQFLRLYEQACMELSLESPGKFFSMDEYVRLKRIYLGAHPPKNVGTATSS